MVGCEIRRLTSRVLYGKNPLVYSGKLTLRWVENGTNLKMFFLLKSGNIPASYVSLLECNYLLFKNYQLVQGFWHQPQE